MYFDDLNSSNIQYTIRMNPYEDWNTNAVSPAFELTGARSDDRYKERTCTINERYDSIIIPRPRVACGRDM